MRQYGNSPTIQQLIKNIRLYFDSESAVNEFYDKIWNIETANSYGLDVWGNIVGVSRNITADGDSKFFGFQTANDSFLPFDNAPFWNGKRATTTYRLGDYAFRRLIMVKAMSNIARPVPQTLNQMLTYLFDGRRCYALDLGGMRARYVFSFYLKPYEKQIVCSDILPRPAGVKIEIVEIPQPNVFGFSEAGAESAPFTQGTFFNQFYV